MKSIKSKILAFAILATLIPSIGLGVLSFWRHQVVISDNVNHELRALVSDSSSEVTMWLRERVGEVQTLSTAYVLADGLTAGMAPKSGPLRVGPKEVKLYLRSVQSKLEWLLELTLSDGLGRVVASSSPTPTPIVIPANWPSSVLTEGVVAEPPRWDSARSTATLTVVVPVLSTRNELLGALSAVVDLGSAEPRLQNLVGSSPAEVILLASDGTPLLGTRTATSALTALDAEGFTRLHAHAGQALTLEGHHRREVIAVAERPRALPLIIVAERDRAEVFVAWLELLEVFLMLTAASTLTVGLVAYWMGRSIVTPLTDLTAAADGIASGDLSVQLRDAPTGEIGHLTRVFNTMTDRLRRSRAEVMAANVALQTQNQLLENLAVTDSLTGLSNRKKLDDILAEQFARFQRNHRAFAVLMLDLDHFKSINDNHGHVVGDQVLVEVAAVLKQSIRSIDCAARYGGEEFVLVLDETALNEAVDVAQRIRSIVESHRLRAGNDLISATVSFGVSISREGDAGPEDALARADRALYEAKRTGRNRVQAEI